MAPASPHVLDAGGGGGGGGSSAAADFMTPAKRSLSSGDGGVVGGFSLGKAAGAGGACASSGQKQQLQPQDPKRGGLHEGVKNPPPSFLKSRGGVGGPPAKGGGDSDSDAAMKKKSMGAYLHPREEYSCEPVEKRCRTSRSWSPGKKDASYPGDDDHDDGATRNKTAAENAAYSSAHLSALDLRRAATKLDEVRDLVTDVVRGGDPNIGGVREARRAAVDVLLHVMTAHPSDGPVQEYCNTELFDMVHRDPRCAPTAVGCAPLLQAVVKGMEKNADDAAVQERACRTLWLLSVEDRHRAPVVLSGACGAVARALAAHGAKSEAVAAAALGAIKPLSVHSKGRAALAGEAGCAASVARAMGAHPRAAKVQAEGCSVLSNLAVDMARRRVAVLMAEEMTAVLAAMRMHPASDLVQRQACFALKNLSHQYENLARMVKCAGPTTAESLLRTANENFPEQCQRQGRIVLQRLEHFRAGPVSVTSSGSIVSSSCGSRRKKKGKGGSVRSRSSRSKASSGSRRKSGRRGKKSSSSAASACSASSAFSAGSHRTGNSTSSASEDGHGGGAATLVSSSAVSAVVASASQHTDRRANDTPDACRPSTWQPDEEEMPQFARQFRPDTLSTFGALIEEYTKGTRGRPAIRDLEAFFGPSRRRPLRLPSWRSKKVRGSRFIDTQICRRSKIYEKIDGGMTEEDLLELVREKNPAVLEGQGGKNGTAVRWAIEYLAKVRDGYEGRSLKAQASHNSRKARKRKRQEEKAAEAESDSNSVPAAESDSNSVPAAESDSNSVPADVEAATTAIEV